MAPLWLLKAGVLAAGVQYARQLLRRARRRPDALLTPESEGSVVIITTAAIPWRTGTAVNPTLRAVHLAAATQYKVTLVVPFVPLADQPHIFPPGVLCHSPEQQAALIRSWAREHCGPTLQQQQQQQQQPLHAHDNFSIVFYRARYHPRSRCIFACEDISSLVPHEASLVLLEEPEHLNWFNARRRWSSRHGHVVGVLHTHYSGYARDVPGGAVNEAAVGLACRIVCRLHCHKVVQLSQLAPGLARSTTVNVHGVSERFLAEGQRVANALAQQQQQMRTQTQTQTQTQQEQEAADSGTNSAAAAGCPVFKKGCYFLGKALWDKGHGRLMDLLAAHNSKQGAQVAVDVFGAGPDLAAIQAEAGRRGLPLAFLGQADHCSPALCEYKTFINACTRDVLATATAEAVAMGKWALLPDAPCNAFFRPFPNVLLFSDAASFSMQLCRALDSNPPPLSEAQLRELSWHAATQRLLAAASIATHEWPGAASRALDDVLWPPYRLFALLFMLGRRAFAPPARLACPAREQPQLLLQCVSGEQLQQQQQELRQRVHAEQEAAALANSA